MPREIFQKTASQPKKVVIPPPPAVIPVKVMTKLESAKELCQRCWSRSRDYGTPELGKDLRELKMLPKDLEDLRDWLPIGSTGTTGDRIRAIHSLVGRLV